jgi:hypothetical protein
LNLCSSEVPGVGPGGPQSVVCHNTYQLYVS